MQIKTAGELREFLATVMVDIKNGSIKSQEATAITKVAAQINQSLAVEVNTALRLEKLGKGAAVAGSMLIGQPDPVQTSISQSKPLPSVDTKKTSEDVSPRPSTSVNDFADLPQLCIGDKMFCEQCDMAVDVTEAKGCKSRFCSLKGKV